MDFKSFIKKIFGLGAINENSERFLKSRQQLTRSASEIERYNSWKKNQCKHFISNLSEAFFQQSDTEQQGTGIRLFILDTPSSKGFICQLNDERYNQSDYQYLFDYFKEKVLELDYKNYLSDIKNEPSGEHVIETQRHYLKPRLEIKTSEEVLDQQFGNITIEYKLINNEPREIKFLCQSYHDSKFKIADDYEKLIKHLLYH